MNLIRSICVYCGSSTGRSEIYMETGYALGRSIADAGLSLVYGGGTNVLMRTFDPALMWRITAEERITTTLAVPAMLNFMLQVPNIDPEGYRQLRWIMSGAAPVPEVVAA